MRIHNDPFKMIIGIVKGRYPKARANIFFVEKKHLGKGCLGETVFPDDGSMPQIAVSVEIPVARAVEILAHELAHLVLGPNPKGGAHGPKWKKVFKWIHAEYCEIHERRFP